MEAIGRYRQAIAGPYPPLFGWIAFYGERVATVNGAAVTQVLIDYMGGREWINIDPRDIEEMPTWTI